jgi:hypothetical protein
VVVPGIEPGPLDLLPGTPPTGPQRKSFGTTAGLDIYVETSVMIVEKLKLVRKLGLAASLFVVFCA